ncbi:hypothetical protein K503DRAFT_50196 [Rhizopogon vinicolor AM-OR11-026]|uniref:DH domain-containing protein n=1 Tax=Rhizopogon vinicolor AM-OR11-026 TaxID=1314800 RepID=A0A1B7N4T4_9AGAM|nr:hypothetical protein K503DRAFT_50196 [Rhizopogon vinicolor AM-OR11-026]
MSTSPQPVSFPSTDSAYLPSPVTHIQAFRRISLPSAPTSSFLSAQHRQSIASLASFELPEEPVIKRNRRRSLNPRHSRTLAPVDVAREAKRAKIVREFWDTERSYVDGLDLVHDHFLIPIIASLDSPRPLLTRAELTTIFSNFIDIWNFHHTFFSSLTALIHPVAHQLDAPYPPPNSGPPPLSPLLLSHFPYLSLYTPFITAFPDSISFLAHPTGPFAVFLRTQERDPRCAKLKLTDWLLTIVQRCPRYVLLLRELMTVQKREKEGEGEWDRLGKVLALVEKVTSSLNTSLHAHTHTLALLALQRATLGLPPTLHFVQPGRTLLFRSPLVVDSGGIAIQGSGVGRGRNDQICEFLLFDDMLVWLDCEPSALRDSHPHSPGADASSERHMYTYRNHLSLVDIEAVLDPSHHPQRLEVLSPGGSFAVHAVPSSSLQSPKRLSSSHSEPAMDTPSDYATPLTPSPNDTLHTFLHLLRQARSALLARDPSVALRGVRMRGVLWAEAYEPVEGGEPESQLERGEGVVPIPRPHNQVQDATPEQSRVEGSPASDYVRPQRAPLPFLPPVWVPDAKTDACMRCARPFGFVRFTVPLPMSVSFSLPSFPSFEWGKSAGQEEMSTDEWVTSGSSSSVRELGQGSAQDDGNVRAEARAGSREGMWRRRHHCRLCGRVVCAECSGRTFYITDPSSPRGKKAKAKPARACNECYEAAFPLVHSVNTGTGNSSTLSHTLLGIPDWLSSPILTQSSSGADALMAMTLSPSKGRIASPSKTRPSSSASKQGVESSSPSYAAHGPGTNAIPAQAKHHLSASPTRPSHPASHLTQISSTSTPSHSPSLSPSSSRFTAPEGHKDMDVPTVRIHNPSARHSYTASADEEEQHRDHEDTPTLRAPHASPPSRPIRIRHSSRPRPRSYHDILEDFHVHARGESVASSVAASSLGAVAEERPSRPDDRGAYEEMQGDAREGEEMHNELQPRPRYSRERIEGTARKKKRFSLPAVAVQTVPVVARSAPVQGGWGGVGRRLSLVLGTKAIGGSGRGRGKSGLRDMESERDGSAHSSVRDDQSVGRSSREDKASKGGESSAARALMDVLKGRRGKAKA